MFKSNKKSLFLPVIDVSVSLVVERNDFQDQEVQLVRVQTFDANLERWKHSPGNKIKEKN